MRIVKRLHLFVLKNFLPLFAMTFFIVLFIVLMQFLWRYIDDLVGKGLSVGLLAELFFYAALSMVPMALPLAILLASLMTFGNLGEKSELTAIKAAGVSLVKTMMPLIILISGIAVGAFFFQNDVLPRAQVKMWTLLFSARQKSPELEIPEGVFYDQIPGFNLYVKSKDPDSGIMRGVMIYDVSKGGDNATILMADSARLAFTKDMRYLYLHLYEGEQFENLRDQQTTDRNVPFRRESFADKEILIPFDANFNRLDEGGMKSQYVGKNMAELTVAIDSIRTRIDSVGTASRRDFERQAFPVISVTDRATGTATLGTPAPDKNTKTTATQTGQGASPGLAASFYDLVHGGDGAVGTDRDRVYASAIHALQMRRTELEFRTMQISDEKARLRRHQIELIKKFTLSVACIIFLFIGAPLGAIIRKGGLGTPLVISVLLFLVYYIIDNTGYKLARDGHWIVWCGMWLSTFILLPLGIFVTYKAMNDSAVFNADLYREWVRRRLGWPESRHIPLKEVIIFDVNRGHGLALAENAWLKATEWLAVRRRRPGYRAYWSGGYAPGPIDAVGGAADALCGYLADSRDPRVIALLNKIPTTRGLWIMSPARPARLRRILMWLLPVGGLLYLCALPYCRRTWREIDGIRQGVAKLAEIH